MVGGQPVYVQGAPTPAPAPIPAPAPTSQPVYYANLTNNNNRGPHRVIVVDQATIPPPSAYREGICPACRVSLKSVELRALTKWVKASIIDQICSLEHGPNTHMLKP